MATAFSLSFSIELQPRHHHRHVHDYFHTSQHSKSHITPFINPKNTHSFTTFPKKSNRYNPILTSSTSHSSSPSTLQDPLPTGRFLTPSDLQKLQFLENFKYFHKLESGYMLIRAMKEEEMDMTVGLLAESFVESMLLPNAYVKFLAFLVKQYLVEKRSLMPHTVTLIGFYKRSNEESEGEEEDDIQLAGTVEVSFDKKGANASPPTPTPPKDSPYICNMTVKKSLRRRGMGWHLLKASEELISQMSSLQEVYLHCRMIDSAPFNMYTKAGYKIVKTDSILILLTLQRRKHLMRKQLPPVLDNLSDTDALYSDEQHPSLADT